MMQSLDVEDILDVLKVNNIVTERQESSVLVQKCKKHNQDSDHTINTHDIFL